MNSRWLFPRLSPLPQTTNPPARPVHTRSRSPRWTDSLPLWLRLGFLLQLVLWPAPANQLRAAEPSLHPITIPIDLVRDVEPGTIVSTVPHGHDRGCFGWLTWAGSPSAPTLLRSLLDHGDSYTYVNPDQPQDHTIGPGDWIQSKPGLSNSSGVRHALDRLCSREIILPVHDLTRGHGEKAAYRVAGFARCVLLGHRLPGRNHLTFRFLGFISCTPANQPPKANAGPDQTLPAPATIALDGTASDDGRPHDTLHTTWTLLDGPADVLFADPLLPITTATFPEPGEYILQLTASDGVLTASDHLRVTVQDANQPPLAPNLDLETAEDVQLHLELTATDPDGDPLSFRILTAPNHGQLKGTPPHLTYTPDADFNGTDSFSFLANDGSLDSAHATVTLAIHPVNDPPTTAPSDLETLEDTPATLTLSAADVEGTPVTVRILDAPTHGALTPISSCPGQFTYSPEPDFHGSDAFTFVASDGELDSAPATVSVTVVPANDPPLVNVGPDLLLDWPLDGLLLHAAASDVDSPALTFLWSQLDGPAEVEFVADNQPTTAAAFPGPGRYLLSLTVSDDELHATDTLECTLNAAPEASAGPARLAPPGEWLELQGSATDDGLPSMELTANWTAPNAPAPVEFAHPSAPSTLVRFSLPGTYSLQLTAHDGHRLTSSTVTWIVRTPRLNLPPSVSAGPDQTLGWTFETQLEATVTDDGLPNPGPLQTLWSVVSSPGPVVFSDPQSSLTRATFIEPGIHVLRFTANDGDAAASDDITVAVHPDNLPPSVDAGPDLDLVIPDPAGLRTDTFQPADPHLALTRSLSSLDAWDPAIGQPGLDDTVGDDGLCGAGTNVFVAGYFNLAGGIPAVGSARWDGTRFHPLFDPRPLHIPNYGTHIEFATHDCTDMAYCTDSIEAISSRGPELFAAGSFKELAQISDHYWDNVARWTGHSWEHWMFKHGGNHVRCVLASPDWVYVGGYFAMQPTDASSSSFPELPWANCVAAWHAESGWTNLGAGIVDIRDTPYPGVPGRLRYHAYVNTLALGPDNSLYAGGSFVMDTPTGRAHHIARWNGQSWEPLGSGFVSTETIDIVLALAASADGSLYAGGNFTSAGGVPARNLARWDGHQWHAVGPGTLNGTANTVHALALHGRDLYVGGNFTEVGGFPAKNFTRWNGAFWSPLGPRPNPGANGPVRSLLTHSNGVFVAGSFSAVSGLPANNIALWRFAQPPPTSLTLHGRITDDARPNQASLTAHWSQIDGPGIASFDNPDSPETTVHFSAPGSYTLQLAAHDGALTAHDSVSVQVRANQPPTLSAGPDLSLGLGEPGTLAGNVADDYLPTPDAPYCLWTLVHGPGTVVFTQPTEPTTSASFSAAGTYTLRLIAHDGHYSASDDVLVSVGPANLPPTVSAGSTIYTAYPLTPVNLPGRITDDGRTGQPTRCIWAQTAGPGTAVFANTTLAETTVTFDFPGSYTLRLTADDGQLTAFKDLAVTVRPPSNHSPNVSAGPDFTSLTRSAQLLGEIADDGFPATGSLSAQWTTVSGPGSVSFSDATSPTTTARFSNPGRYTLRLTASDGQYNPYDTVAVTIDTAAPTVPPTSNQPPQPNAGPDLATRATESLSLTGIVEDPDLAGNQPIQARWLKLTGPGRVTFDPATSSGSGPYPLAAHATATFESPGVYTLQLTADDTVTAATDDLVVTVFPTDPNLPPVVDSSPTATALVNRPLSLANQFTDDLLPVGSNPCALWSATGPGRVYFDDPTQPETRARFALPGTYSLQFTATDGRRSTPANTIVSVATPPNQAPIVDAGPNQSVVQPNAALLSGTVLDDGLPAGSPLAAAWSLIDGPGSATFLPNPNVPVVNAAFSQPGTYTLQLAAHDALSTNSATVHVTVHQGTNTPPELDAGSNQLAVLAEPLPLHGTASDDGLPAGQLQVHWTQAAGPGYTTFTSINGLWRARFNAPGTYTLQLHASDGTLTSSDELLVTVLEDLADPIAQLDAIPDLHVVATPTAITGTASSPLLASWNLACAAHPDAGQATAWTTLAQGNSQVLASTLGTFDPTLLPNGTYRIRLTTSDVAGRNSIDERTLTVDGRFKPGVLRLQFTDLTLPIAGLPIRIERTYDSRLAAQAVSGEFGIGWSLATTSIRIQLSAPLADHWEQAGSGGWYALQASQPHLATVTFPGDHILRFLAHPETTTQFGRPFEWTRLRFSPLPGSLGQLEIDGENDAAVVGFQGPAQLIRLERFEPFNPDRFILHTPDGWTLRLDTTDGLVDATDPIGRSLAFSTTGIVHSANAQIPFERDPLGRITRFTHPNGQPTTYDYDEAGHLVAVTTPDAATTRFAYDDQHRLTSLTTPDGVTRLTAAFDDQGRLVAQRNAAGLASRIEHDLTLRRELVVDRLGHATTLDYDDRGNLARTVDALGFTTVRTHDDRNRLTSITRFASPLLSPDASLPDPSPADRTLRFAYDDQDHLVALTDPLGQTTRFAYDPRGNLLSLTDPRGFGLTNSFDVHGLLLATADALGHITAHSYSNGLRTSTVDALGHSTRFAYDHLGRLTNTIDPLGRNLSLARDPAGRVLAESILLPSQPNPIATHHNYDLAGRLTNTTSPNGATRSVRYDPLGRPIEFIDPLGRSTRFTYDLLGRLSQVVRPDTIADGRTYDDADRLVAYTNQLGLVTRFHHDPLGRTWRIENPDGSHLTRFFDAFGQVIAVTDARGHSTWFGYDPAGHPVAVTNSLGYVHHFSYDANGNPVSTTDPLDRTTLTEFDPLNQPARIQHPDGAIESLAFDPIGQLVAATDALGNTTRFDYDPEGHLVAVTNALGLVTRYAYNPLGHLASITDPNLHVTTLEHDALGHLLRRTLPLGQSESFSYDLAGQLIDHTDFNGHATSLAYDELHRLTSRTPDPRLAETPELFAYDALGQLIHITDAAGTTRLSYDPLGRLASRQLVIPGVPDPLGIAYQRDPNGNLTRLRTSTGGTDLTCAYDPLNRIASVTDPAVGHASYAYDPAGNLAATVLPNLVTNLYSHDPRHRLTRIEATGPHGPLASFAYSYDALGRRSAAASTLELGTPPSSLSHSFAYDPLSRLLSESTLNPDSPAQSTLAYTHDPVGNRLTLSRLTPDAAPSPIESAYDANDRPLNLAHDSNGNPLDGITTHGDAFQDSYDSRNRLLSRSTSIDGQPASMALLHTALGDRIARSTTTPATTTTTLFLVDDQNPTRLPQILEELNLDDAGQLTLQRLHTFGLTLLALRSPAANGWTTDFVGLDALGSVRHLTNPDGHLIAFHDFDAFGNLTDAARWDTATASWQLQPNPSGYLFASAYRDPDLHLDHLRARDYDPATGRFRTSDPFPGFLEAPSTLHRYLYARNDPVNRIDPTGYYDLASVSLGVAIGRSLHDQYDATALGVGYGLMDTIEGINLGRSDEEILLRYETGAFVGAGAGILIGKVVQIAGRALTGELPLPSPSRLTTSVRQNLDSQILHAREIVNVWINASRALSPSQSHGVSFFDRKVAEAIIRFPVLGRPQEPHFFMPVDDAALIRTPADASRLTGRAPSVDRAYLNGEPVFGLAFPTAGLPVRAPSQLDAGGWPHFLPGGRTAVATADQGGFLLNPTRELVIPGGKPIPAGSVLFELGERAEWRILHRW